MKAVLKYLLAILFTFLESVLVSSQAHEYSKCNTTDTIPMTERMDGIWIGTIPSENSAPYVCRPLFAIMTTIENGQRKFILKGTYSNLFDKDNNIAQHVINIDRNRTMLVWATEKLRKPDQDLRVELKSFGVEMGNELGNAFLTDNGNFLERMGTGLLGSFVEKGFGALVDALFTPSKKIYLVVCNLYMHNPYEMTATIHTQLIKAKGDGQPEKIDQEYDITFVKWEAESGVFFMDSEKRVFFPFDKISSDLLKEWKKDKNSDYNKYKKVLKDRLKSEVIAVDFKFVKHLNILQLIKLQFYVQQQLIKMGEEDHRKYVGYNITPFLGCEFEELSVHPELLKDNPQIKGVYIKNVVELSSAELYNIRKGDILLSVDGFEIESIQQAKEVIATCTPFNKTIFRVLRKGTVKDIPVELSFKFIKTH